MAECWGEANSKWGAETHGTNGDLTPNGTSEDLSFCFKLHDGTNDDFYYPTRVHVLFWDRLQSFATILSHNYREG